MRDAEERLAGGRLTIDLDALTANWRDLAARARGATAAAVVKADAYGIGLEAAGAVLASAGCRTFFVAAPAEGIRLRAVAGDAAIYVLNGLIEGAARDYVAAGLRPVLGSWQEVAEWAATSAGAASAIHVDTGLNRLGLSLAEARRLAGDHSLLAALGADLLVSHLAVADSSGHAMNARQRDAFHAVRALFPALPASLANSAGILLGPDFHFDVVRPGIAMYGGRAAEGHAPLRPVVTAEARVLAVREAEPGETVGYGATETLRRPTRIAILGAGYADGYHRSASSSDRRKGARVRLRGRDAPVVGRVSMDLMAVDATDIPGAARGDWAELFGGDIPVDEVADRAGTIGYELLTALGRRYARRYVGGTG